MSKLDIGVGEDFPVDEPPPQSEPPEDERRHGRRGYGRHRHPHRHFGRYGYGFMAARILAKFVMIALVIGALSFLFHAPFYAAAPGPYAVGAHPFWHFGFFFPGFFLIALLLLAFGHRHHHHHHSIGHDGMDWRDRCRDDREEA